MLLLQQALGVVWSFGRGLGGRSGFGDNAGAGFGGIRGSVELLGQDEHTVRWIENWLNGRAQRVVMCGSKSSWRLAGASGVSRGQYWVQYCSTYSSVTWMMGPSAPAACWLAVQNWEERLTLQRAVLPVRGTSTGWRDGKRATS